MDAIFYFVVLPFALTMWAICLGAFYFIGKWLVEQIRKGGE